MSIDIIGEERVQYFSPWFNCRLIETSRCFAAKFEKMLPHAHGWMCPKFYRGSDVLFTDRSVSCIIAFEQLEYDKG